MTGKIEIPNLDNLLCRYLAGEPEQKLATECGVSRWTFRQRLLEAGIAPRNVSQSMYIRWQNATPSQRAAMVAPAHDAVRGLRRTVDDLTKRALGKEARIGNAPVVETTLLRLLLDNGLAVTHQKAIGPYNVDIAINTPPIAVELFGGGWHAYGRHKARHIKRCEYLLDHGWAIVVIWLDARRYPFGIGCVDYILSFTQSLRHDKALGRQYRVILGNGDVAPIGKSYLNTASIVERLGCG